MEVLKKIILFFFYVQFGNCFASNTSGQQFPSRKDYKYDELAAGWVKWHQVPATWHEARLRCYYEGADLASPINENLKKVMHKALDQQAGWFTHIDVMYTGIHSKFSNGDYTSIDGVPFEIPIDWSRHDHSKNCLILNRQGYILGSDCSTNLYPYMCYKRAPKDLHMTMCGTIDQEYEYSPQTGSCYKFHRIGRTWSRAFMTCLAEGGHLAIINSDVEAQVVKELFQKYLDQAIMATYTHTASIGFQDWGERGSWWTIHGQDLSQAGYEKWDKGSPDRKTSQFCGSINRSGKLNDIWCDGELNTFPAICEISPVQDRPV